MKSAPFLAKWFASLALCYSSFFVLGSPTSLHAQSINVLIVYTPAVEAKLGANGAKALAISSITSLNQVMRNSGLASVSYRLAGNVARKVNYVESVNLMDLDLDRLTNPTDGFMDEVHTWRTQVGADLVHLLRLGPAGSVAGIAWLSVSWDGTIPGPVGSAANGFAVTADDAAVSNYTFAHEVGHNMGLWHAREDTASDIDGPTVRDSWFGYRFKSVNAPTQVFNTVMAYSLKRSGLTQSRIPHFSNPAIRYAVVNPGTNSSKAYYPTGLKRTGGTISSYFPMPPETVSVLPQGPSDQVEALKGNAPIVAAYVGGSTPASNLKATGSLAFSRVVLGRFAVKRVSLQNPTLDPVVVDSLVSPDPAFMTDWSGPKTIPPRGAVQIAVTFRPTAAVSYTGDLVVNVAGVPAASFPCTGTGIVLP